MKTNLEWFFSDEVDYQQACELTGYYEPKKILTDLNLVLSSLTPPRIAIPSKDIQTVERDDIKLKVPTSYKLTDKITKKLNGRKAVWKTNGSKHYACLEPKCFNMVNKYNHCIEHRDVEYEKAFEPKIMNGNSNTLLVAVNGRHYQNSYFRVTINRLSIVEGRVWYLNPRDEIFCKDGKLLDMLVGQGWKCKQKVKGMDYTNSNLEIVRSDAYVPEGKVTCHVPLGGDKGFGYEAKVDLEHFDFVKKFSWNLNKGGYARCKAGLMHRLIMASIHGEDAIEGMIVDHVDGDRLNNTVSNLRIATEKQNAKNRTTKPASGFEGVEKDGDEYVCRVKKIDVFRDTNPKMCALVYDSVVTYVYGEGCRLNDNKSEAPLPIDRWNLDDEVLIKLKDLKSKHTDLHGVKHTRNGWKASIKIDIGLYSTQEEAGRAYDIVAQLLKSGAPLNFEQTSYSGRDFAQMMQKLFEA